MSAQTAFTAIVEQFLIPGTNRFVGAQVETAQQIVSVPYPPATGKDDAGRPPHRRSGHLQANIHAIPATLEEGAIVAGMGVPMDQVPYARRLELGFVGTDSLGRHYSDPPKPYLRPAAHLVAERAGEFFKI